MTQDTTHALDWTPKLIASDIDGTLLNADRALSPATIKELKRAVQHVPFVFISARMPQAMTYFQRDINRLRDPLICYNGALVMHGDCILSDTGIHLDDLRRVQAAVRGTGIHLSVYSYTDWWVPSMDYWARREQNNTRVSPTVMSGEDVMGALSQKGETLLSRPSNGDLSPSKVVQADAASVHKIMAMGDAQEIQALYDRITGDPKVELHAYRSKDTYIEFSPQGIDKSKALQELLTAVYPQIGMKDVLAFGDNYNDVNMLQDVGYGVAVDNAREPAKAAARHISDLTNKEDAVANFLARIQYA